MTTHAYLDPGCDHVEEARFRWKAMLQAINEEKRFIRMIEDQWRTLRARRAAKLHTEKLKTANVNNDGFQRWSPARARDIQDFDYLLMHREHLPEQIKEHLEIAAAKMSYVNQEGEDGYFKKLQANIRWKDYITPIILSQPAVANDVVRCGIWANARNSRRCHKSDVCPFCLWNDYLRVQVQAFGTKSSAFIRSPNWMFITISFTTRRKNSKAVGKDLDPDDFAFVRGDHLYDPFPVCLGGGDRVEDCEFLGYEDVQVLGRIILDALDELYKEKIILGYRSKLEGAFMLIPGHSKRVNFHGHSVANGPGQSVQSIANIIYQSVQEKLRRHRLRMNRLYYADVLVLRINTAEDLERCVIYSEKVVPIDKIVADALSHATARGKDGALDFDYVDALKTNVRELLNDDLPSMFSSLDWKNGPGRLMRRKVVGNMRFRDKSPQLADKRARRKKARGGCIGDEPGWHVNQRRKRAKDQRKRRAKQKKSTVHVEN
jgi:hypothetical protein